MCLFPAFILKQGIGMCDCLYTGALLNLCHVLLIVVLGDLCPLVFFHPVVFPCGSQWFIFFPGHLWCWGHSKTRARLSAEQSAS